MRILQEAVKDLFGRGRGYEGRKFNVIEKGQVMRDGSKK